MRFSIEADMQRLVSGNFSQPEIVRYFIASNFIGMFYGSIPALADIGWWLAVMLWLLAIATIYQANGGQHGVDFLLRFIVLGTHVSLRLFPFQLMLMVLPFQDFAPHLIPEYEAKVEFFRKLYTPFFFAILGIQVFWMCHLMTKLHKATLAKPPDAK